MFMVLVFSHRYSLVPAVTSPECHLFPIFFYFYVILYWVTQSLKASSTVTSSLDSALYLLFSVMRESEAKVTMLSFVPKVPKKMKKV